MGSIAASDQLGGLLEARPRLWPSHRSKDQGCQKLLALRTTAMCFLRLTMGDSNLQKRTQGGQRLPSRRSFRSMAR